MRAVLLSTLFVVPSLVAQSPQKAVFAGRAFGPDGNPIEGALVAAVPGSGNPTDLAMVRTDAQGRFRLVVNPGSFGITATYPTLQASFQGKLVAEAGKALSDLSLHMESGGHTISGQLLGPDGHPVKDGLVFFDRISNDEGDRFFAHMKGDQFAITLGPGNYILKAKAPGLMDMSEQMALKGNVLQKQIQMEFAPSQASQEVKAWIKAHAIPLATSEAGNGFVDMEPLKAMVGKAHVVSLGEATHGTREFFQLKHRMLEFLVEEMGFTVFAIEANQPEARAINDYVLQGKGDPAKALSGLNFWTWNTEEVLAMIRWMRQYNENPKHIHKVKFYGFDMQFPDVAWRNVRDYLGRVDPGGATWMETSRKELGLGAASRTALSPERKQALLKAARDLVARFDARKEAYLKAQDPKAYPDAQHDAKILAQSAEMELNAQKSGLVRDRCMAENVQWILKQEQGAKAVLWAHNGHVSTGYRGVMGGLTSMGTHLHKALGPDMLVLGFSFLEGGFQAWDMKQGLLSFQVKPNPKATLALALASVGYPILALDLRKLPKEGPVSIWFKRPQGSLECGSMFSPKGEDDYIANKKIAEHFDGLLFVSKTTAARPNSGGRHSGGNIVRPEQATKAAADLGFEEGTLGQLPQSWIMAKAQTDDGFKAETVEEGAKEGKLALHLFHGPGDSTLGWATTMQAVDPTPYLGRKVRLSGWIRTDGKSGSEASFWMRIDRESAMGFFDNAKNRAVNSTEWTRLILEGNVDKDAKRLNFGCALWGKGQAWFDGLTQEIIE